MKLYKKIFVLSMVFMMMVIFASPGMSEEMVPPSGVKVLDLSKLSPDDLMNLEKSDPSQIGKSIFYAPEDYELVINLSVNGSVVSLEDSAGPVKMKFHKPVYVYFPSEGEPVFSVDGNKWDTWGKLFTGSISFGFSSDKDKNEGRPASNLSFTLDLRGK